MPKFHHVFAALAVAASIAAPARAAEQRPEIARAVARPQATGVQHTVRTIPEACARLEGAFTGQLAAPYRFAVVRTSATCHPRARFVDAAKAQPWSQSGWLLNDLVRVPSAACPSQQAVVRVWRKPGSASPPALDAQGRARIYLQDAQKELPAKAGATPLFAATMTVEGAACR
ncbi:hypothetical protein N800_02640 [Lysobacter daejeonensis GH1-9]|uniref:Secreted protein n=1 Tax=Lysobacter daejeonensis GH1-9 TaxID=1385517 RepID=A0A0A0F051_9GAMM|nr:hypothetical protein [Lysobacter daejeonensis]KGM54777.1 hypothetical protein N800_02640 [Lysobacter daejeonensis GH1-9]